MVDRDLILAKTSSAQKHIRRIEEKAKGYLKQKEEEFRKELLEKEKKIRAELGGLGKKVLGGALAGGGTLIGTNFISMMQNRKMQQQLAAMRGQFARGSAGRRMNAMPKTYAMRRF